MQRRFRINSLQTAFIAVALLFTAERAGTFSSFSLQVLTQNSEVHVPLDNVTTLSRPSFFDSQADTLRQVLRIIDLQHVEPERLDPVKLLASGIAALSEEFSHNIEFGFAKPILSTTEDQKKVSAILCVNGKSKIQYCKDSTESTRLGRSNIKFRQRQEDEIPSVRVGNRVFYTLTSPLVGLRYVDSLARPTIAEFSKRFDVPLDKALHVFLNGMLHDLDPHSSFLNEDEYRELRRGTRGQFGGVGLVFEDVQAVPVVRDVVSNSPAQLAGVVPGDVLVRIGEAKVAFSTMEDVVKNVRAYTARGETFAWFYRPSNGTLNKVKLSRKVIPTQSVVESHVMHRPDVLHVRITGFSNRSSTELQNVVDGALNDKNRHVSLMVLDLRGNPGGLLDQAVQVSDLFLNTGKIVGTKTRYDEQSEMATQDSKKYTMPIVVLVDSSSASASEIVAGALRDHNRALVIGERTFGKGSVQSLFELEDNKALKLTMAHYFVPSGHSIQNKGVEPHISVRLLQSKGDALWMAGNSETNREEDLAAHLENPAHDLSYKDDAENFGDGKRPAIWAHHAVTSTSIPELKNIDFSYPNTGSNSKFSDTANDPFLRVALAAADEMLANQGNLVFDDEKIRTVLNVVQQKESHLLAGDVAGGGALAQAFQDSGSESVLERPFFFMPTAAAVAVGPHIPTTSSRVESLLAPIRPLIPNMKQLFNQLSFSAINPVQCCDVADYGFELSHTAIENRGSDFLGFVGIRLATQHESPVVWTQAKATRKNSDMWSVRLTMPRLFRSYFTSQKENVSKAVFYFKERLDKAGIVVGKLDVGQVKTIQRLTSPMISSEAELNKMQVHIPLPNFSNDSSYKLRLVNLTDAVGVGTLRKVDLERASTGALLGEFDALQFQNNTEFNGLVGAILENEGGEILGRWPLISVENGEAKPISQYTKTKTLQTEQGESENEN